MDIFFANQQTVSEWNFLEATLINPKSYKPVNLNEELLMIDTQVPEILWQNLMNKFRINSGSWTKFREYYHDDMVDTYDYKTDLHRVSQRRCIHDMVLDGRLPFHIASYYQDMLPTHRFPNLSEMDSIVEKRVASSRVTNRIHIIFEESDDDRSIKIKIQNHEKMDQDRLQEDVQKAIASFL